MFTSYDLGSSFQSSFMGITESEAFFNTSGAEALSAEQIDQMASHPYAQHYNSESLVTPNGYDFNSITGIGDEPPPRLSYDLNGLPGFPDNVGDPENEELPLSFANDQINLSVGTSDTPVQGSIHWNPNTMSWGTAVNADLNGTSITYDPGTGATSIEQQITDGLTLEGSYAPGAGAGSASLSYDNFEFGAFINQYDWGAQANFNLEF